MSLSLSTNTRPDIALTVSQVAQFTSNPKQSHASAVKMIIRITPQHQIKASSLLLPLSSRLIVMWMLTLLVCMAENLRNYLQVPTLVQDTSCSSALALSFGKVDFKQRLPSAPSMQNMLPSPQPSENSSPSNEFSKNLSTAYTFPTQLLSSMLNFLMITTQPTFVL